MAAVVNAQNYMVPASGAPRSYRVTKEFVLGQPHEIDFRQLALDGASFIPYGVFIDNSQNDNEISVIINESAFRMTAGARQHVQMTYPAPMNQTATIVGQGKATVIFCDFPVIPFIYGGV